MKKIFLIFGFLAITACASKKKVTIHDIPPKKAELYCTVDDRVVLFRSAFNYAVEDNELDSIYRFVTKSYYYNVREKFNPLKNHDLVNFIATHDYIGVDLPAIALCFEPETFQVKDDLNMEVLKFKYGKYYTHLDTLSVLLKDYHDKAEAHQVILPPLDFTSINTGFVNDSLDFKLQKFFKKS
ncbi:hypothetical protein K5I29_01500 [Flavobacterium agricola]|uniref:DUF4136 domain-containing protein n=1 Tax=Flavobacterium agricola TaxID=2870839 RepID=A0ABY6LZ75_9FLAO|nr:hypothetical protein [Flavobacterium agricola]UYW01627.1 hypothetical protein K5I29_01500 [Flavobacterium agricola]